MINEKFWHIDKERTWAGSRKQAEWDHEKMEGSLESIHCPANPGHQREGNRLFDLNVVLPDGEIEDFVWTWYSECLMQDHTLELLRANGFTGFEVKPVQARFDKSAKRPPMLWELVLTGWAGMTKPESGIRLDKEKSCLVCGHLNYTDLIDASQLIDKSNWDGSDFFMVWPIPKFIFVTERVVRFIRDQHLTGVSYMLASEIKSSPNVIPGYTPGRLSYYMPDDRARQLGEPLGIY